ncbi:MAG: MaoC family dehydratase N-terminal domain-containing protein [Steroidobacteraceae bacterium]
MTASASGTPITSFDADTLMASLRARIGLQTAPTVTEVEKGAIAKFAHSIGATSPLHFDERHARNSRFGGIVAPPTYVSTFITGHIPDIYAPTAPLTRTLHSDDSAQLHRPIRAGDVITAYARYVDAVLKAGRSGPLVFQSADLILDGQDGERIAEVRVVSVSF